ncbi:hypothetical protein Emed_002266 [Eimeria media]
MPPSTPGAPPPPPSRELSIAESVQRAQAIAASLARSKGALGTPQQQGGSQGPPPPGPPLASTPSPGPHGFTHRPSAGGQRGPPHPPPPFDHAAGGGGGAPGGPRGTPSFDHGAGDKTQQSQYMQTPGRSEASWSSVDAAAAIAAQQKQVRPGTAAAAAAAAAIVDAAAVDVAAAATTEYHATAADSTAAAATAGTHVAGLRPRMTRVFPEWRLACDCCFCCCCCCCLYCDQMLQQRARRAALRAMETVCAAIPKPDIKESDLLGEIKKTALLLSVLPLLLAAAAVVAGVSAVAAAPAAAASAAAAAAVLQRQLENGVWVMDFPLQSGVCAATAASPDAWQQLQRQELIANLRRRTGAGFVLRGRQQQQQQQGVYLRVASEDQETVFRGVVAAWSVVGARQHLPAPVDAADDETFDCACAMAGEEQKEPAFESVRVCVDEFLKDVFRRTGVFVEIEHEPPQGYGNERGSLRYSAAACTQGAMDKATRLLRWRLGRLAGVWIRVRLCLPCFAAAAARAAPAAARVAAPASAAVWLEGTRVQRRTQGAQQSASPERRGPPNKLSFAPPPDELLTGPYAPLDK